MPVRERPEVQEVPRRRRLSATSRSRRPAPSGRPHRAWRGGLPPARPQMLEFTRALVVNPSPGTKRGRVSATRGASGGRSSGRSPRRARDPAATSRTRPRRPTPWPGDRSRRGSRSWWPSRSSASRSVRRTNRTCRSRPSVVTDPATVPSAIDARTPRPGAGPPRRIRSIALVPAEPVGQARDDRVARSSVGVLVAERAAPNSCLIRAGELQAGTRDAAARRLDREPIPVESSPAVTARSASTARRLPAEPPTSPAAQLARRVDHLPADERRLGRCRPASRSSRGGEPRPIVSMASDARNAASRMEPPAHRRLRCADPGAHRPAPFGPCARSVVEATRSDAAAASGCEAPGRSLRSLTAGAIRPTRGVHRRQAVPGPVACG